MFFVTQPSSSLDFPNVGENQGLTWLEADEWYLVNLLGGRGNTSYPLGSEPTNAAPTASDGAVGDYYLHIPASGYAILYGPKQENGDWPLIGRADGSISTGPHAGIPVGFTDGGTYGPALAETSPYDPGDTSPAYNYKKQIGLISATSEYYGDALWVYNTVAGWYPTTVLNSINNLDDVVVSVPTAYESLMWDGTNWVNNNYPFVLWENIDWVTLISGAGAPTAATGGDGWYYLDTTPGSEALYGPATFNPALLPTGVWDWGSPLANFTFSATGPTDEAGDWYVWDENGDGSVYTLFQKKTQINYGDMLFWDNTKWHARSKKFSANDVYVDLTNIDPAYGVDNVRVALSNLFSNKADKFVTLNDQTGTTYTLQGSDYGKMVTLDNAAAITVTVPADTFIAGDVVGLLQKGAGQVSVAGDVGVTVNSVSTLDLSAQWATASLLCIANNEFVLTGNLA